MHKTEKELTIHIRRRTWLQWILLGLWILWLVVWAEFAIGSVRETEPRAVWIGAGISLISAVAGLRLFWRPAASRVKKLDTESVITDHRQKEEQG